MGHGALLKGVALVAVLSVWVLLGLGGYSQSAAVALVLAVASVPVNIAAVLLALSLPLSGNLIVAHLSADPGTVYLQALTVVCAAALARGQLLHVHNGVLLGSPLLARRIPVLTKVIGAAVIVAGCLALSRHYPLARYGTWVLLLALCGWSLRRRLPPSVEARPRAARMAAAAGTLIMLALSAVFTLAIVEVGARLVLPPPPFGGDYIQYHPEYFFLLRPNGKGQNTISLGGGKEKRIRWNISSQGLRDEFIPEKEPGEYRVCILGDSHTMGHATELEDTVPKQLEVRLRALCPGRKIRVINCGVNGAGCLQELGMLRERALPLKPDLVILQLFMGNDVENALTLRNKVIRPYDVIGLQFVERMRHHYLLRYRLDEWIYRRMRAYQSLSTATGRRWIVSAVNQCRLFPRVDLPNYPPRADRPYWIEVNLKDWYPELEEGFRVLIDYARRMEAECRTAGIDFMAYCVPEVGDISDSIWAENVASAKPPVEYERRKGLRLAEEALTREGIAYVPVAEAICAYGKAEETYFPLDGHMTRLGNALVAETLASSILPCIPHSTDGTLGLP